ncbi:uncharacterized protein LOC112590394 [Harpegnathos saltator]|uniref:uncharacterized protein LOC112590394 n=1 Tax=Harpegnathos saltator TaxID=610380 RepID=UPI000DBEECFA|nr:uncharacterized protein LOC112590394 [Harpegnathos saltator]
MSDQLFESFTLRNAFHPADSPHGMRNYDLGALTRDQKRELNEMKMITRKENEIYLHAHPEVRALIAILLRKLFILHLTFRYVVKIARRHVLSKRPLIDIPEVVGTFFNRPRREIAADLLDYSSSADKRPDIMDNLGREVFRANDHIEIPHGDDSDSQICDCVSYLGCCNCTERRTPSSLIIRPNCSSECDAM